MCDGNNKFIGERRIQWMDDKNIIKVISFPSRDSVN